MNIVAESGLSWGLWILITLGLFGDYPQPGVREPCFDARQIMLYHVPSADFVCVLPEQVKLRSESIEGGGHRVFWDLK